MFYGQKADFDNSVVWFLYSGGLACVLLTIDSSDLEKKLRPESNAVYLNWLSWTLRCLDPVKLLS